MTGFPRTAVIMNPRSANGRTGKQWARLESKVRDALHNPEILTTSYSGHATELARQALRDEYECIVSAGGDGTHHEVVEGFFDKGEPVAPEASFGILPLGTGSDLARTLGLPRGELALPHLTGGQILQADVIATNYAIEGGGTTVGYCINVAHAGAGAAVADRVNRTTKCFGGFASFLWGVLATLATYDNKQMDLDIDGVKVSGPCRNVIAANGVYDGGGIRVAPKARLDSGVMEVYVIGNLGRIEGFTNVRLLYQGRLMDRPDVVQYFQARRIVANSAEPVLINLDGEVVGGLPATFTVLPGAIRLICPAS